MFPARRYPHILCLAANEKDFSLLLEMTIRETVLSNAEALLLRARNDECGRKAEMLEAAENRGGAVKKRDEVHRMADANKAFAHFRF